MSSHAITRTIVVAILLGAPGAGSAFGQVAIEQLVDKRVTFDHLVDERPVSGMRFGTLTLSPALEIMTGLDTNVFNQVEEPKSDLMTSVSPTADARLRLGRGRAAVSGHADFVRFDRYASERSVDGFTSGGIVVPFNRVRPYAGGSFLATRQRPSFEIDARSRRREVRATAGVDVQLTPITSVRVNSALGRIAFVGDAVFQGTWLRDVLNRESRTIGIELRHSVTPLTTVTMGAEADQDVFQFSRGRNARSRRMTATVELAPFALISGNASLGWRAFDAADTAVPDYRGVTGAAELSYVLLGSTQFTVQATRDIEYSFEPLAPYYVLTGTGGTITQRLTNSIAITATTMLYGLQFRGVTEVPRIDRHTTYGAGAFYRIGRRLRVNVNGEYFTRRSPVVARDYRGLRSTTSLTYGM